MPLLRRPPALFLVPLIILIGALVGVIAMRGLPGAAGVASAARPLTYVAIGASDSVGVGADNPETEGWVAVLHGRLPRGSRLVNLGVSGSLTRQAVEQQLPVAIDSDPDVVTVWLAVNDLNARVPLERYSAELDTLLGALREQTRATVFVANVPDVARVPVYQQLDREQVGREVGRWNAAIARAVEKNGAHLVDLHAAWDELAEHPEYVGRDGFHPSTDGHRRLADIFLSALGARMEVA
jgi:acyl-CoA thioesterase I